MKINEYKLRTELIEFYKSYLKTRNEDKAKEYAEKILRYDCSAHKLSKGISEALSLIEKVTWVDMGIIITSPLALPDKKLEGIIKKLEDGK